MNIEDEFPARYWINLGRRQERRFETEWQLEKAGFAAERFPAIDARFVRRNRGYESAGRYALALSQRLVIRKAMLAGAKAVLVLEDDVIFHPELKARLEEIEFPDDWGIFYLGCANQKRPKPAGSGLVRTPYALDTHAFAVRAPYYRQVMAALSRRTHETTTHARASDWFLADLHKEIPTYACYPNLAWQAVSESDLAGGTYSNYTASGEQRSAAGELIGLQAEMWGGSRWDDMTRGLTVHRPPKLGLLFLTRGGVNHPEIWQEFLADAGDGVSVFSHVKERHNAGFLANHQIEEWHDTRWGDISLVHAMLALLRSGLADESLTHFSFVSESCIPIRPWSEMDRRLLIDARSMISAASGSDIKPKHWKRLLGVDGLPAREMRVHSQWVLLSREAAECVLEHDFTSHFSRIEAPDEHYFGTVMAVRGYPDASKVQNVPSTWVCWNEGDGGARPVEHSSTTLSLVSELAASPCFFARKFPEDSDIGRWGLHRINAPSCV